NAAPPELKMLAVGVMPRAGGNLADAGKGDKAQGALKPDLADLQKKAGTYRSIAKQELAANRDVNASDNLNWAAALEQTGELLVLKEGDLKVNRQPLAGGEGPSVTYHLNTHLTIPSRNDEQVIEVTKIDMAPEYFYKAVPVLTPHVYRLANLTNKSPYV